jgi:hypothetical protein
VVVARSRGWCVGDRSVCVWCSGNGERGAAGRCGVVQGGESLREYMTQERTRAASGLRSIEDGKLCV